MRRSSNAPMSHETPESSLPSHKINKSMMKESPTKKQHQHAPTEYGHCETVSLALPSPRHSRDPLPPLPRRSATDPLPIIPDQQHPRFLDMCIKNPSLQCNQSPYFKKCDEMKNKRHKAPPRYSAPPSFDDDDRRIGHDYAEASLVATKYIVRKEKRKDEEFLSDTNRARVSIDINVRHYENPLRRMSDQPPCIAIHSYLSQLYR